MPLGVVTVTSGIFAGFLLIVLGIGVFIASIIPLNLDRYKEWTIRQLYYLLYPYIKDDFMGRGDCRAVHATGNMIAGDSPVTHTAFQGGDDTQASIKERTYQLRSQEGSVTLSTAQNTGEFQG